MKKLITFLLLLGSFNAFAVDYPTTVEEATNGWPEVTAEAVKMLTEKYGEPSEISASHLIWLDTAPFKRTILHKEPVLHNFPTKHEDFITQVIDYKVPLELFDEIAMFNGSVMLDRTRGEMSATCHLIEANILSLNLAHEVATKVLTVEEARTKYGESIEMHQAGNTPEIMTRLMFEAPEGETADPDEEILD